MEKYFTDSQEQEINLFAKEILNIIDERILNSSINNTALGTIDGNMSLHIDGGSIQLPYGQYDFTEQPSAYDRVIVLFTQPNRPIVISTLNNIPSNPPNEDPPSSESKLSLVLWPKVDNSNPNQAPKITDSWLSIAKSAKVEGIVVDPYPNKSEPGEIPDYIFDQINDIVRAGMTPLIYAWRSADLIDGIISDLLGDNITLEVNFNPLIIARESLPTWPFTQSNIDAMEEANVRYMVVSDVANAKLIPESQYHKAGGNLPISEYKVVPLLADDPQKEFSIKNFPKSMPSESDTVFGSAGWTDDAMGRTGWIFSSSTLFPQTNPRIEQEQIPVSIAVIETSFFQSVREPHGGPSEYDKLSGQIVLNTVGYRKRGTKSTIGSRKENHPIAIVHHSITASTSQLLSKNYWESERKSSAHFVVCRDGRVFQLADTDDATWESAIVNPDRLKKTDRLFHSSPWRKLVSNKEKKYWDPDFIDDAWLPLWNGSHAYRNPSLYVVNIVHQGHKTLGWTDKQYNSSLDLTEWCMDKYSITPNLNTLIGHNRINSIDFVNCPGSFWPIEDLINDLT